MSPPINIFKIKGKGGESFFTFSQNPPDSKFNSGAAAQYEIVFEMTQSHVDFDITFQHGMLY